LELALKTRLNTRFSGVFSADCRRSGLPTRPLDGGAICHAPLQPNPHYTQPAPSRAGTAAKDLRALPERKRFSL